MILTFTGVILIWGTYKLYRHRKWVNELRKQGMVSEDKIGETHNDTDFGSRCHSGVGFTATFSTSIWSIGNCLYTQA